MLEISSVVKKIVLTLIFIVVCNSTYAHAKTTSQMLYEAERDFSPTGYLPKKFYIGLGLKAPSFASGSFDTTGLFTEDGRKLMYKINNLGKMLGQKSVDPTTLLPSSLNYSPGFGTSLMFGYITDKFGTFELEGAFNRVFISQTARSVNHDNAAIMLNWYADLLHHNKFSLFGGGGIVGNSSWISVALGLPITNFVKNVMLKAKAGVKFQLTESVDLITSYEFSFPSITENFIVKSKIIHLLEAPEKTVEKSYFLINTAANAIFSSGIGDKDALFGLQTKQSNSGKYMPHGPTFELRIRF